jgi:hypothetical protein
MSTHCERWGGESLTGMIGNPSRSLIFIALPALSDCPCFTLDIKQMILLDAITMLILR